MKFVLLALFLALASPARANPLGNWREQVLSLENQKQQKQKAAQAAYKSAAQKAERAEFLRERLEKTQRLRALSSENSREIGAQLRQTERAIRSSRREVEAAQKRFHTHQNRFGARLAALQKGGAPSVWGVLLGAQSLGELSQRTQFFQTIARHDAQLSAQLRRDREELQLARGHLLAQWNRRRTLLQKFEQERGRIADGEREQFQMWRQIESSRQELLRYALAQQRAAQEITARIGNLQNRRTQLVASYNAQIERGREGERRNRERQERRARAPRPREIERRVRRSQPPAEARNSSNGQGQAIGRGVRPRRNQREIYRAPRNRRPQLARRQTTRPQKARSQLAPRVDLQTGFAPRVDIGQRFAPQISNRSGEN